MKHTQGPWKVEPRSITGNQFTMIADHEIISPETTKANAKLIAAAPEMFEALKTAKEYIKRLEDKLIEKEYSPANVSQNRFNYGPLDQIECAIAKAIE